MCLGASHATVESAAQLPQLRHCVSFARHGMRLGLRWVALLKELNVFRTTAESSQRSSFFCQSFPRKATRNSQLRVFLEPRVLFRRIPGMSLQSWPCLHPHPCFPMRFRVKLHRRARQLKALPGRDEAVLVFISVLFRGFAREIEGDSLVYLVFVCLSTSKTHLLRGPWFAFWSPFTAKTGALKTRRARIQ